MRLVRAVSILLVATALAWAAAGDALADRPVSATFTDSGSGVFATCEGFDVVETATVRGRDTVYFDHDGHAVRHVVHIRVAGTFSNSETGEVLSPDHAAFTLEENLSNDEATNEGPRPGTYRVLGLMFQIKVDGQVVALDAGHLFVDIGDHDDPADDVVRTAVGRRDVEDGFDICAALG